MVNQTRVPDRHPTAQYLVDSKNTRMAMKIALGGLPEYAGDRPNARPVPNYTIYDYRNRFNDYLNTNKEIINNTDIAFLNFCSNQLDTDFRQGVIVSNDILWWLLRQGDMVLLSDGDIDHYTNIALIDYENEKVSFMDRWPDRFFLKKGKNSLGIASDHLTITKEDFKKVIIGVIILDSTMLLYSIGNTFPSLAEDIDFNLSAGITLLDLGRDTIAPQAIPFLTFAHKHSKQKRDRNELFISCQLYYACLISHFHNLIIGAKTMGELAEKLMGLEKDYGAGRLLQGLNDYELGRLGNISAWAQQFNAALEFLTLAISLNKNIEMPFYTRGKVFLRLQKNTEAQEDFQTALNIIDKRISDLNEKLENHDPDAHDDIKYDSSLISGLENRKFEIQHHLAQSFIITDLAAAVDIATRMSKLKPKHPLPFELLSQLYIAQKNWKYALYNLDKASILENDLIKRNTLIQQREEVAAKVKAISV